MPTPLARILVIDDDPQLAFVVRVALEREGYRVFLATDGKQGLDLALSEKPDLLVLDVDLPRLTGLEVSRELRRVHFDAPILMLTGRGLLDDKVSGLNAGADDYLPKPFEPREFLARVQALVRRHHRTSKSPAVVVFDSFMIDLGRRVATHAGKPVDFTKTEFAILEVLARTPGQPVSRETLLDIVWGYTRFPNTRTVDTHVWRLRKKIGDEGEEPRWIKRVHGQGYLLAPEAVITE